MKKQMIINEEILWDYVDGLLSEAEQEAVQTELSNSDKWIKLLEKVQAEKAFFQEIPSQNPSAGFSSSLLNKWEAEQAVLLKKQQTKSKIVRWIFTVMGALLLASLCVFFYAVLQSLGNLIQIPLSVDELTAQPTYWYSLLLFTLISISIMMEKWDMQKSKNWVQV